MDVDLEGPDEIERKERRSNRKPAYNIRDYRQYALEEEMRKGRFRTMTDEERMQIMNMESSSGASLSSSQQEFNAELWPGGPSRFVMLAHTFMILLLVALIMLQVKNFDLLDTKSYEGFSFFVALGVPATILVLIFCDLVYEKFLKPLKLAYELLFYKLTTLLVIFDIAAILFVLAVSWYMSQPKSAQAFGVISVVLYFVCWIMVASAFGFVTPGLFNKKHDYPIYRVVLCICYLLFFFAYPFVIMKSMASDDV